MSNTDCYMVVGLGNPGKEYEKTRHNIGFMAIDFLAQKLDINIGSQKFKALYGSGLYRDKKIILLKPQTYMNLSGQSVLSAMSFYKLPPQKVIVIFDDISLPVGKVRIRAQGSHGGHNGIKNIMDLCGSNKFPRIKMGAGIKPEEYRDLKDWVLSKLTHRELEDLNVPLQKVCQAIELMVQDKIEQAMNDFN